MKIRSGFVSNSSSSSFIVRNKDWMAFKEEEPKLTKEEIDKLLDYGFFRVERPYALELENSHGVADKCDEDYNFGYYVTCNEDEVIQFLLENKIPFEAATQYGQNHIFYNRGDDYVLVARNFGLELEMYENKRSLPVGGEGIRKVKIADYLD